MRQTVVWLMATIVVAGVLDGCHAETSKNGSSDGVKMSTPFGGLQMKVRTNQDAAESGTGLPIYPGATLVPKGSGKDDNESADINLSFGSMRLRVEVLSYETGDSSDQVRGFYQKELGRFGTVIACVGEHAVGVPNRTTEGLTCDKDSNDKIKVSASGTDTSSVELKAGSPQHQHAVSIEKNGTGTKFALIRIDLPKRFVIGDDHAGADTTQ